MSENGTKMIIKYTFLQKSSVPTKTTRIQWWALTFLVLAILIARDTVFVFLLGKCKISTVAMERYMSWMCSMWTPRLHYDCDRWAQLEVWRLNDVLRALGHSFIPILTCTTHTCVRYALHREWIRRLSLTPFSVSRPYKYTHTLQEL